MADQDDPEKVEKSLKSIPDHAKAAGTALNKALVALKGIVTSSELWKKHSKDILGVLNEWAGPFAICIGLSISFLGGLVGILKNSQLIERSLQAWSKIQYYTPQFAKLLGGLAEARKRLGEIESVSSKGPFKFEDIAEGSKRLETLSRGAITGKESLDLMTNSAAAAGISAEQSGEAMGQAFKAIQEQGNIDGPISNMADLGMISMETADHLKLLSASGASSQVMFDALKDSLSKNKGAAAALGETLRGMGQTIDNLKEKNLANIGEMFSEGKLEGMRAGKTLIEAYGPVLQDLLKPIAFVYLVWNNLKKTLADFAAWVVVREAVKLLIVTLTTFALIIASRVTTQLIGLAVTIMRTVLPSLYAFVAGTVGAEGAMVTFGVAIRACFGPIGVLLTLLGALVIAFEALSDAGLLPKWLKDRLGIDETIKQMNALADELGKMGKVAKGEGDIGEKMDAIKSAKKFLAMAKTPEEKKVAQDALNKVEAAKVKTPAEYLNNPLYMRQAALVAAGKADKSTLSKEYLDKEFEKQIAARQSQASGMMALGQATGNKSMMFQASMMQTEDERMQKKKHYQEDLHIEEPKAAAMASMDSLGDQLKTMTSMGAVHASSRASVGLAVGEASGGASSDAQRVIGEMRKIEQLLSGMNDTTRQAHISNTLNQ